MSTVIILGVAALGVAVAIGLAYGSMRLVVGFIASNIRQFIARQRERRAAARLGALDRRGSTS